MITQSQWDSYTRHGFLHLGKVISDEVLEILTRRADDLAMGRVSNPNVRMQRDTGGVYEELPGVVSSFEEGTLVYRKIQGLETDDQYGKLVSNPLFLHICAWHYGTHAPVSLFRAMVMNKPAGQGTVLPWHQDGGDVWALDRDPLVTIWVALDPATRENGCLEVVPGTHRLGLLSAHGSTLSDADVRRHCPNDKVVSLEVGPGCAVLLHNWLIHRSGINPSPVARRAFTACFMDGRTRSTLTGDLFPLIAGTTPSEHLYLKQLRNDCDALRASLSRATEYASSLRDDNENLRASRAELEQYANSLEAELRNRPQKRQRWLPWAK